MRLGYHTATGLIEDTGFYEHDRRLRRTRLLRSKNTGIASQLEGYDA